MAGLDTARDGRKVVPAPFESPAARVARLKLARREAGMLARQRVLVDGAGFERYPRAG